jgi:hypothetical protein
MSSVISSQASSPSPSKGGGTIYCIGPMLISNNFITAKSKPHNRSKPSLNEERVSETPPLEVPLWTTLDQSDPEEDHQPDPTKLDKTTQIIKASYPSPPTTKASSAISDLHDHPHTPNPNQLLPASGVIQAPSAVTLQKKEALTAGNPNKESRHGIATKDSIASALADSFEQNGVQNPSRTGSPPSPLPSYSRSIQTHLLQYWGKTADQQLETVQAQLKHSSKQHSMKPLALNFRFIESSVHQTPADHPREAGQMEEDHGRVGGFIERLESLFGPGDIQRGSGKKPRKVSLSTQDHRLRLY